MDEPSHDVSIALSLPENVEKKLRKRLRPGTVIRSSPSSRALAALERGGLCDVFVSRTTLKRTALVLMALAKGARFIDAERFLEEERMPLERCEVDEPEARPGEGPVGLWLGAPGFWRRIGGGVAFRGQKIGYLAFESRKLEQEMGVDGVPKRTLRRIVEAGGGEWVDLTHLNRERWKEVSFVVIDAPFDDLEELDEVKELCDLSIPICGRALILDWLGLVELDPTEYRLVGTALVSIRFSKNRDISTRNSVEMVEDVRDGSIPSRTEPISSDLPRAFVSLEVPVPLDSKLSELAPRRDRGEVNPELPHAISSNEAGGSRRASEIPGSFGSGSRALGPSTSAQNICSDAITEASLEWESPAADDEAAHRARKRLRSTSTGVNENTSRNEVLPIPDSGAGHQRYFDDIFEDDDMVDSGCGRQSSRRFRRGSQGKVETPLNMPKELAYPWRNPVIVVEPPQSRNTTEEATIFEVPVLSFVDALRCAGFESMLGRSQNAPLKVRGRRIGAFT